MLRRMATTQNDSGADDSAANAEGSNAALIEALRGIVRVAGKNIFTLAALSILLGLGGAYLVEVSIFRSASPTTQLVVVSSTSLLAAFVLFSSFRLLARQVPNHADAPPAPLSTAPALEAKRAMDFDVFIALQEDARPWTTMLKTALERLDSRVVMTARFASEDGDGALARSRQGILLVTPEGLQSDWARAEWERMRAGAHSRGFRIIPVFLGAASCFPFASRVPGIYVDTDSPMDRVALAVHEALFGTQTTDVTATLAPAAPAAPRRTSAASSTAGRVFVNSVFDQLRSEPVLLLAPEDRLYGPVLDDLRRFGEARYPTSQMQQLVPMAGFRRQSGRVLHRLGRTMQVLEANPRRRFFQGEATGAILRGWTLAPSRSRRREQRSERQK